MTDTWGRGYTDTPMVPHTPRLFGLALLFAVASSPLPWTAEGFSIIGFSLGGGITMDFVASYPDLIKSVVLLAPAGLLRSLPPSYEALIASAWAAEDESSLRAKLADVLEVENVRLEQGVKDEDLSFEGMSLGAWQFHYHEGHLASFASTVCHGPIKDQDGVWKQACTVLTTQSRDTGPRREKLLVVCGAEDFIVVAEELKGNLERLMGKNEFMFETVPGGHGFPVPEAERVVEIIAREWEL